MEFNLLFFVKVMEQALMENSLIMSKDAKQMELKSKVYIILVMHLMQNRQSKKLFSVLNR